MLELRNVHKRFGQVHALRGIDLTMDPGCIIGLLGPNGAGKTTTIKTILGLLRPDIGSVSVFGTNPMSHPAALERVGYIGDYDTLYPTLTGRELLAFLCGIHKIPRTMAMERTEHYLKLFDLTAVANRLIRTYSSGNIRKLAIISGLIHEPDLVIADEPTVHLDPPAVRTLFNLFGNIGRRGGSVLMSTHVLSAIKDVCQTALFLDEGRISHPPIVLAETGFGELERLYRTKTEGLS